jgi:urease accessory protein
MATCTRARRGRPITTTTTRTDASRSTGHEPAVLEVDADGIRRLRRGARLAPRVIAPGRAVLVPTQAGPLDGDHDRVHLHVGPGATLVMEPIAATLALPGRSRLELHATIEAGGRLLLDEPPLILAEGADVTRRVRLELAEDAVAAIRDVVVLGRSGEGPGRLDSELRATLAGRPLLHDAIRINGNDEYVALAPGHRVAGTIALLGIRDEPELAGPGALRRATGPDVPAVEAALERAWARWRQPFSIGTLTMLPHSVHEPS